jgi:transcriptional regulator with XRE-family HTH domain
VTSLQDYPARYKEFLRRLRQARLEAGLTQTQVADTLEKPQSFVSKCETGERRVDVVELQVLASLYGVPLSYFVEGIVEEQRE